MLSFDLPLEECKKYMGTNPCPKDFDEYWDSSIEEMHSINTEIEFVPVKWKFKNVEAFDIWYTGVGGAKIHGKCVKPANITKPAPCVLMFHGYSWFCYDFPELMSWAAQGYVAISIDVRGQGGISEDVGGVKGNTLNGHIIRGLEDDDPKKLFFRSVFLDCAELAYLSMKLDFVDENNVFCMGGSQGGALSTVCAALEPRIKKAVITYPFLSDYQRVWNMEIMGAYEDMVTFFRLRDPLHERENEIFLKLGYIDVHHLAKRIKAEVMMHTALKDQVCPPSTQFAVFNNITSKKTHRFWYDYGHEYLPMEWNFTSDFFGEDL